MTYIDTHRQSIKTNIGEFMIEQRNVGFARNDGRWIVSQLPELYWSPIGVLMRRRRGAYLGDFATKGDALAAIERAELQPVVDEPVDAGH